MSKWLTPRESASSIVRSAVAWSTTPMAYAPTATTHVANLLGKLGVDNRAAAIALAYRHGILTVPAEGSERRRR